MSFKIKVYKEKWVFGLDPSKTLKFQLFTFNYISNVLRAGSQNSTKITKKAKMVESVVGFYTAVKK